MRTSDTIIIAALAICTGYVVINKVANSNNALKGASEFIGNASHTIADITDAVGNASNAVAKAAEPAAAATTTDGWARAGGGGSNLLLDNPISQAIGKATSGFGIKLW